jgi:hypothetical protein
MVGAVKATTLFQIVNLDQADSDTVPGSIHDCSVGARRQVEDGRRFEIVRRCDLVLFELNRVGIVLPIIIRPQDGTVLVENSEARVR